MASPTAAQRVWPRCSGPVGLAEMNSTLKRDPATGRSGRRRLAGSTTTVRASSPCAAASRVMLRKPGPATSTVATPSGGDQRAASSSATARGLHAGGLGQLQRDVGGVVAVVGVAGTLDGDLGGDESGVEGEVAVGHGSEHGCADLGGDLVGRHAREPIGAGRRGRTAYRRPATVAERFRGTASPLVLSVPALAPVAQGIERCPPEACAQVRILPGALNFFNDTKGFQRFPGSRATFRATWGFQRLPRV